MSGKYIQVIMGVMLSALVTLALSHINVGSKIAVLTTKVEVATDDRYYGRDAKADFALRDERHEQNDELIKANAEAIAELERIAREHFQNRELHK
jgi:hypothetical protein